ncbi:hypothetical protein EVG20_g9304 [Dentipellis fragilis]|uniref:DH domain-containing protein n=1 Tax=Dentipellis fragilis TaxID=205917 RepID=A0A4Y9Y0A6_9AGAM|nr:hypothetical protein EVG20_g9304 [Dentipellis fragilis]
MALSTSPRKTVPLSGGDDWEGPSKPRQPGITRRVFYCGVVVESENGRGIALDVQELIQSLGDPLSEFEEQEAPSAEALAEERDTESRIQDMTDTSAIQELITELVTTERSYVKRLHILKQDYADPLRSFARSKETAIIPAYEAKTLFGNLDDLLPVNQALLSDLEKMMLPDGPQTVGSVGDVVLRHFKERRGFERYKQYYSKREEAQKILKDMTRRSSSFAGFIDRIKYSSADTKNRIGLSELLMDPVQRIPRYTLLFRTMIKRMPPGDIQRAKLIEANEIASKIAQADVDDETKRATILTCLEASVDGFPVNLISNSRHFIDCIDVQDVLAETPLSPLETLHCTLFLFDDKLILVKRPGNGEKTGRSLSGIDQADKVNKSGKLPSGLKKSGLSCKGVFDVSDVVATDVGGSDFHLYLEVLPQDQTDRWSGRPFRALSVVFPPAPVGLNPVRSETEKKRFLEKLWHVQAKYRTKTGNSIALRAEEREVESKGGRVTFARTYYNLYQRTAFLRETKKTKVIVHIDPLGSADPIPFGMNAPPYVSIRLQPMAGDLSRYSVTSSDPNDEGEEDIVQTLRVPDRIVHTIHQYGLFKFGTGKNSVPSTPTASTRSRAAIFGLDMISRNLFGALPGSSKGDLFGGSISGHRRTKSFVSRSSTYTTSEGSLMRFSHSSKSTVTAATSMSSMDEDSFAGSRSSSRSRKLLKKRSKSPMSAESSPRRSRSQPQSREVSRERMSGYASSPAEDDEETVTMPQPVEDMDESEWDLTRRLELARQNSQNQHGGPPLTLSWEQPVEETIYEEEPPQGIRPSSRASRVTRPTTPVTRPQSTAPTEPERPTRPQSALSHRSSTSTSAPHPRGPRSPSPLPPSPTAELTPFRSSDEIEAALETTLVNMSQLPTTPRRTASPLPRSRRQPFDPAENMAVTPKMAGTLPRLTMGKVEPLSIKKVSTSPTKMSPTKLLLSPTKSVVETPPLRGSVEAVAARGSGLAQTRVTKMSSASAPSPVESSKNEDTMNRLIRKAEATKVDVRVVSPISRQIVADSIYMQINSSRKAVKRIRMDAEKLHVNLKKMGEEAQRRPQTPLSRGVVRTAAEQQPVQGAPRSSARPSSASRTHVLRQTRDAQERMEELHQVIQRREGGLGRTQSITQFDSPLTPTRSPSAGPSSAARAEAEELARQIDDAAGHADGVLKGALEHHNALGLDLEKLAADLKEKAALLEKARTELQNAKRQCDLVKDLLADTTAEKEIMYEAFNEELDKMYTEAQLPDEEAWTAMTQDLRQAKAERNSYRQENSHLKRRLAQTEMEKEECVRFRFSFPLHMGRAPARARAHIVTPDGPRLRCASCSALALPLAASSPLQHIPLALALAHASLIDTHHSSLITH